MVWDHSMNGHDGVRSPPLGHFEVESRLKVFR